MNVLRSLSTKERLSAFNRNDCMNYRIKTRTSFHHQMAEWYGFGCCQVLIGFHRASVYTNKYVHNK
jgi:hypothetical protein